MRSFLTIFALLFCFLPTLASATALKGVRGHKRSLQDSADLPVPKEKKCKKFKEVKEVSESIVADKKKGADKADPKAAAKGADKADPKATAAESSEEVGANLKGATDPKATDPKAAEAKAGGKGRHRHLQDDKATPVPKEAGEPKDPKAKDADALAREAEENCLEWEEAEDREDSGSDVISDPSMGATLSSAEFDAINVDCEAIANDEGPTDVHSVSFSVNMDVMKSAEATLKNIYAAMEQELQQKVAPRVAGCSDSGRFLASSGSSSGTKIVHVDFGEMEFDHQGCDSSLAKEASEMDGVCMSSDVPVDVYFVGDFPENAMAKVEVAIEEHQWDVDGLLKTSEVAIAQTGSSMPSDGGDAPPGGMIGGIVAAVAACCCAACGYGAYRRNRDGGVVAKAELETDEESSDDEKYNKVAIPEVQARQVR